MSTVQLRLFTVTVSLLSISFYTVYPKLPESSAVPLSSCCACLLRRARSERSFSSLLYSRTPPGRRSGEPGAAARHHAMAHLAAPAVTQGLELTITDHFHIPGASEQFT